MRGRSFRCLVAKRSVSHFSQQHWLCCCCLGRWRIVAGGPCLLLQARIWMFMVWEVLCGWIGVGKPVYVLNHWLFGNGQLEFADKREFANLFNQFYTAPERCLSVSTVRRQVFVLLCFVVCYFHTCGTGNRMGIVRNNQKGVFFLICTNLYRRTGIDVVKLCLELKWQLHELRAILFIWKTCLVAPACTQATVSVFVVLGTSAEHRGHSAVENHLVDPVGTVDSSEGRRMSYSHSLERLEWTLRSSVIRENLEAPQE